MRESFPNSACILTVPKYLGAHSWISRIRDKLSTCQGLLSRARSGTPASAPTQVDRNRRDVVSVGLRSCDSIARRSSTRNCVSQLHVRTVHSVY